MFATQITLHKSLPVCSSPSCFIFPLFVPSVPGPTTTCPLKVLRPKVLPESQESNPYSLTLEKREKKDFGVLVCVCESV